MINETKITTCVILSILILLITSGHGYRLYPSKPAVKAYTCDGKGCPAPTRWINTTEAFYRFFKAIDFHLVSVGFTKDYGYWTHGPARPDHYPIRATIQKVEYKNKTALTPRQNATIANMFCNFYHTWNFTKNIWSPYVTTSRVRAPQYWYGFCEPTITLNSTNAYLIELNSSCVIMNPRYTPGDWVADFFFSVTLNGSIAYQVSLDNDIKYGALHASSLRKYTGESGYYGNSILKFTVQGIYTRIAHCVKRY